jgi:hypothetical protein
MTLILVSLVIIHQGSRVFITIQRINYGSHRYKSTENVFLTTVRQWKKLSHNVFYGIKIKKMLIPPRRVLSPEGRFIYYGGRTHLFYIKQGRMCLPPGFKVLTQTNGRLAIYKEQKSI